MGVTQSTGHAAKSENEFLDEKLPDLPESVVTLLSTWPCQGLRPGLARASGLVLAQEQVGDRHGVSRELDVVAASVGLSTAPFFLIRSLKSLNALT